MAQRLSGKVVLITGGSSGIGRAMAIAMAAEGARLSLVARSEERLRAVADRLPGTDVLVVAADLTRPDQVEAAVARTLAHFGRIDILLANAGVYVPGDVADGDPDAWDHLLALNVGSVFRMVHAVLAGMMVRGSGDIIITSSVSGHQAIEWEPIYSASKHALQAFVHGVRRQIAKHGIRLGAIAPGVVLNELWGQSDPARIDQAVANGEGLRSEDVAEAVVFMLTRPPNVTIRDLVILPLNQDI